MKAKKPNNPDNLIYKEFRDDDNGFRGKKIRKVETDVRGKRSVKNYKKAWEDHYGDWDEKEIFEAW